MKINKENAKKCIEKVSKVSRHYFRSIATQLLSQIRSTFEDVGKLLQANGGRYLVGDTFTAADLTFASMAALVVLPEEGYGASLENLRALFDTGTLKVPFIFHYLATPVHPSFPDLLTEFRNLPAGQHALRMYKLHRSGGAEGSKL